MALGTHNWDIKAAVLPSEAEMSQIQGTITGIFGGGFSENTLVPGSPELVGSTIRLPMQFNSPFNIPTKIKELSGSITDGGVEVAQIQMEESEVNVPAMGTANFTLVGTYTGGIPTNPQLSSVNVTVELYGVEIQLHISVGGAGP